MIANDQPVSVSHSAMVRRYGAMAFAITLAAVSAATWLERQSAPTPTALASQKTAPNVAARLAQLPKPRETTSRTWFWRADHSTTASIRAKPQFKNFVTDPSVGMPQ